MKVIRTRNPLLLLLLLPILLILLVFAFFFLVMSQFRMRPAVARSQQSDAIEADFHVVKS